MLVTHLVNLFFYLICSCGAATWLLEMATEYPACSFTGIDISPMFPTEIKPRNVQFMQRNAVEGLPFPDETFDFVFMRIMYLSFTKEQWENVVRELSRVLKPGGWIELMECNQYLTNMGPLAKKYVRKGKVDYEQFENNNNNDSRMHLLIDDRLVSPYFI
jgi:ubiquinone/menaquinone biosynthesis C-methylase UbiE